MLQNEIDEAVHSGWREWHTHTCAAQQQTPFMASFDAPVVKKRPTLAFAAARQARGRTPKSYVHNRPQRPKYYAESFQACKGLVMHGHPAERPAFIAKGDGPWGPRMPSLPPLLRLRLRVRRLPAGFEDGLHEGRVGVRGLELREEHAAPEPVAPAFRGALCASLEVWWVQLVGGRWRSVGRWVDRSMGRSVDRDRPWFSLLVESLLRAYPDGIGLIVLRD